MPSSQVNLPEEEIVSGNVFKNQTKVEENAPMNESMLHDKEMMNKLIENREISHITGGEIYADPHKLLSNLDEKISGLPENVQMNAYILAEILSKPFLFRDYDDRTGNPKNPVDTNMYAKIKQDVVEKIGYEYASLLSSSKLDAGAQGSILSNGAEMATKMNYANLAEQIEKMRHDFNGYDSKTEFVDAAQKDLSTGQDFSPATGYNYKGVFDDEKKIEFARSTEELIEEMLGRAFSRG